MKHSNIIRTFVGVLLLFILLTIPFITPVKEYFSIPNEVITMSEQSSITVPNLGKAIDINSSLKRTNGFNTSEFYAEEPGENELIYKAAGFPIKKVNVSILDDVKVVPGGQSIGVQLHTLGVLVVGHHLVNGHEELLSPGEKAEVIVGDVILKINGNTIKKMDEVKPFVEKAGKNKESLKLTVKRGNNTIETALWPVMDHKESEYRIGLYIRDSAAGIGTMSFYDPTSKNYGALGHVISDMDTKKPIEIHNGTIVRSSVTSIEKGNNGVPGEKQAKFSIKENKIGSITKNSPFGIFGKLSNPVENDHTSQPMSIGLAHEVKEGPAKILTVVEEEKVEEFDVEIISSIPQKFPATKGMVVQIKDPKLLERTGGIVQGMSGSPIIQNGKIIGAITHVFVNDPTSGYGVHIEWMLQEAGIDIYNKTATAS